MEEGFREGAKVYTGGGRVSGAEDVDSCATFIALRGYVTVV
jgi:hypothetical protein